jgi:TatD DNase family protein
MIDTHAHLNEIEDIDQAVLRARENGISGIVAVGMDLDSNRVTLDLADRFPEMIYPAIGYHPWSITVESIEENLDFIEKNLAQSIALGEVGIDYKTKVKKKIQWEVFSRVLSSAKKYDRPVIVHSRFSHERSHQLVVDGSIEKAVFHWYTGSLEILEKILSDRYYISATPALSYSPPHQAAMKAAPIERILAETDSPVEYQGLVSEPANLTITLQELSRIKGMDFEEVRRLTTNNAKRFFEI